jgi:hypothetical protein
VTIPLIALLLFPKAETLYYRYVDNIGLPFRRFHLRRLPRFITEPYLEVFKVSSLGDRLAAAITTAAVLAPFSRHLLATGAVARSARSAKLEEAAADLEEVMIRAQHIQVMYHDILGRQLPFMGGQNGTDAKDGPFQPKTVHMEVNVNPQQGYGAYYESFFLEVMVVVKRAMAAIRSGMRDAPRGGGVHATNGVLTMETGHTTVPLSPHVRTAVCLRHRTQEYFVRSSPWMNVTDDGDLSGTWIGPTAGCSSNGSVSHPPAALEGGRVVQGSS